MNNITPRVSVGMPVYNGETFLAESIESILKQTFRNFELIISDNASTDGTEAICQSFAATDKRITYYRNDTNFGAAANFNRVFQLSSGEYFKWATADDLCAADYLQKSVEILDREPDVALCYGKTKLIDEKGAVINSYEDGLHLIARSAGGRFLQLMHNMRKCNAVCGVIRSDVLRKTRLIGNYIGSDECLLAELSLLGRFWEVPEYLFFRREHPGSSSADKTNESQLEFFDPNLKGHIVLRKWRHSYELLSAIKRAPARLSQKVLPVAFVLGSFVVNPRPFISELIFAAKRIRRRHPKYVASSSSSHVRGTVPPASYPQYAPSQCHQSSHAHSDRMNAASVRQSADE